MRNDWTGNSESSAMSTPRLTLQPAFAPEVAFEIQPLPAAISRRRLETALADLQQRSLDEQLERTTDPAVAEALRWAAADAAAVAWQGGSPLLTFPVLFQEKAREAVVRARRQKAVLARTRRALLGAAHSGLAAVFAQRRRARKAAAASRMSPAKPPEDSPPTRRTGALVLVGMASCP
jgi:hypothetical protein